MIIGLGFRKRAGKDEIANYLQWRYGYARAAFAEPLKEAAKIIFGWTDAHVHGELKEVVDEFWGFTPRWALQTMGTEAMRNNIDQQIWVKATMRKVVGVGDIVVTDVRFPNEAEAIKAAGGVLWRVDRPDLGPATDLHPSETALLGYDAWDAVIVNDGSLQDLGRKVEEALNP